LEGYEWEQKKELARLPVVPSVRSEHIGRVSKYASVDIESSSIPDILDEIGDKILILQKSFAEISDTGVSSSISIADARNVYSSLLGHIDLEALPNQAALTYIQFLRVYAKLARLKSLTEKEVGEISTKRDEDQKDALPLIEVKKESISLSSSELTLDELRRRRIKVLKFPSIFSTGLIDSHRISPSINFKHSIREGKSLPSEISTISMISEPRIFFIPLADTIIRQATKANLMSTIEFWEKVNRLLTNKEDRKEFKKYGIAFSTSGCGCIHST
jgi:transcriptional regulator NrdR family protein